MNTLVRAKKTVQLAAPQKAPKYVVDLVKALKARSNVSIRVSRELVGTQMNESGKDIKGTAEYVYNLHLTKRIYLDDQDIKIIQQVLRTANKRTFEIRPINSKLLILTV